ncbi:MAG: hypothetical protein AB1941_25425 [Gemmatimonadota bacterium]
MAMMDELVQQISQRAGIPEDKARTAAHAAVEFLDGRLPAPVGGNLKRLVDGGGAVGGGAAGGGGMPGLGDVAGGLGGMFGKRG